MKKSFGASAVISVAVMACLVMFASTASVPAAQQGGAGQAKAAPGPLPPPWDGKVDLTGTWGHATAGPGPIRTHGVRAMRNGEPAALRSTRCNSRGPR
jgi:hypothetical protein